MPPYLSYIIDSFLSGRTTSLKINKFDLPNGLPQGSLLSVTLCLIYNSNLLLLSPPSLKKDNISIAYIDNVTHLIATETTRQGLNKFREIMVRSKNWSLRADGPLSLPGTLNQTHQNTWLPPAIAIFSDSQEALKSTILLSKKTPGQKLTTEIFNNFQNWSQHFPIKSYWCPGHVGIQQNKEVYTLAKEAASSTAPFPHTLHHISISISRQTTNIHSRAPPTLLITELTRVKLKTPQTLTSQALDQLEKGLASTIHQLCSGHTPLNACLHQIMQGDSPRCPHCNTPETTTHYLLY
ncbi:hypothetical protein O181_019932 [Austropuccinia psidii MF-1]|uniref:Reverse transcriptase domain-containing protein n=1 Tax=Austropuccinia psidii MF-1 TaxID=1389203 RepID=A0A9Q3CAR4_9BASI|nr:hypothetical protein [Austropuccinia psidii MF-1]